MRQLRDGDKVRVLINLLGPGNRKILRDSIRTVSRVLHKGTDTISLEGLPYEYTFNERMFELVEDFEVTKNETVMSGTNTAWSIAALAAMNVGIAFFEGPMLFISLPLTLVMVAFITEIK